MFGRQAQTSTATATGSGIIISEDGYILTNNHIVNTASTSSFYEVGDASKVTVYLYNDETPYPATIVGQDELTDIAVIKIDKTGLTPAELGNSDNLQAGEFAMVVGNTYGFKSSDTCGNISAPSRTVTDPDGRIRDLIQTDAAINSGNSGGALVNSKGQVVGISTMKISAVGVEGICFAIPINSVTDIYKQLIQYNKVKRPYVGFGGTDVDEKTAKYYNLPVGIYVNEVLNFSPAEKAGLKVGDVIIKIDNKEAKTMNDFNNIKYSYNIGDTVTLTIIRDNKEMNISVTLSEQP